MRENNKPQKRGEETATRRNSPKRAGKTPKNNNQMPKVGSLRGGGDGDFDSPINTSLLKNV